MSVNMIERREKLKAQLKDKKYRDAFVSEHIDTGIPFQIRALRKQWKLTQKELSDITGMAQERISVAENPNYSRFNIKTLKRIASAFEVALIVRFVPISELVKWELNLSSEALEAVSFEDDPYFKETIRQEYNTAYSQPEPLVFTHVLSGGFAPGGGGIAKFINPQQPSGPNLTVIDGGRRPNELMKESQKEMGSQLQRKMTDIQLQQGGGN